MGNIRATTNFSSSFAPPYSIWSMNNNKETDDDNQLNHDKRYNKNEFSFLIEFKKFSMLLKIFKGLSQTFISIIKTLSLLRCNVLDKIKQSSFKQYKSDKFENDEKKKAGARYLSYVNDQYN